MTGVQTCALRSEEHTSELQSHDNLVCRLLLEKTKTSAPRCRSFWSRVGLPVRTEAAAGVATAPTPPGLAPRSSIPPPPPPRSIFIFFNNARPPKISPLPPPAPLPT